MKTLGDLKVSQIAKKFQENRGVESLEFSLPQGEGFSLLGPSGCGKSTTLRIIGGFENPDSGKIFHGTKEITQLPPQKRDIRTVFQKFALFPHLNVQENVAFGLRMQKKSEQEIREKVDWALDLLEIHFLRERNVKKLSGGEQQRTALARALVTEPSVLLLDEPLSALDLKLREKMQLELLSLRKRLGITFLFVTHDQSEAMALSDRIAVMKEGKIQQVGNPSEIYQKPNSRFVADFIGQANFLPSSDALLLEGDKENLPEAKGKDWMIRPEHFSFRSMDWKNPKGHVSLKAKLLESAFLGADRVAKCQLANGKTLLWKSPSFEPLPVSYGENLHLSLEVEDLWAVDAT
jgi:ABC-type Fe3+/spermidine/putrescine transport system ATPase subunit